jgi:hypothetical protein
VDELAPRRHRIEPDCATQRWLVHRVFSCNNRVSIDRSSTHEMHAWPAGDRSFCLVFFRARIDHHHSRVVVKYKMVRRHRRRRLDGSLCDWTCRRQRAGEKKRRGTDRRDACCGCVLFLILQPWYAKLIMHVSAERAYLAVQEKIDTTFLII